MDALIQLAEQLADKIEQPFLPIDNRVAYVVSHGQSYASNGYAVRTQGVAKALIEHGLDVLCFVRPGRPWELNKQINLTHEVVVDGLRYVHADWVGEKPTNELDHLEQSVAIMVEWFKVYRPSKVLVASNYIIGLPAFIAAKQLGIPFFNEVRGFWELSRDAMEPGFGLSPEFQLESNRDAYVAKQAQKVFTLNQPMKKELIRRGVAADVIELVPNGVSQLPEIKPANPALKAKLGIGETDTVIGYIGSITAYEGLETLFSACEQLIAQGMPLKLLLVGDSQPLSAGVSLAQQKPARSWLIQAGRVPHTEVADYYALVHAMVIPRKKLAVCDVVPPLKAPEALAYGKRLLVSNVGALSDYAEKYDQVQVFEAECAESLASELQKLLSIHAHASLDLLFTSGVLPAVNYLSDKPTEKKANIAELKEVDCKRQPLADKPEWRFAVQPLTPHELKLTLTSKDEAASFSKGAVIAVGFKDSTGELIPGPYSGFASSAKLGLFVYLNQLGRNTVQIMPPLKAASMSVTVQKWNTKREVYVEGELELINKLQPLTDETVSSTTYVESTQLAENKTKETAISLSELVVAGILDEFTTECFRHEVKLLSPTPNNWQQVLGSEKPDLLFVESCWFGNANAWSGLIYGYTSNGPNRMDELIKLISYCRKNAIPTVFWAKEDPVHFSRFAPTAKLFDYVFTTDANMVSEYQKQYGIAARPLSFFCQPKIHNPLKIIERNNKAVFAGSYYSDKAERCRDFHTIMDALLHKKIETDIYDRCFERGLAHLTFPPKYADNVIGTLKPEDMWKAYKGYRYTVNLNTVKHSPTMFARRVYESLASGTPVISNYSEGVRTQFGGIVCASDNSADILEYLDRLQDNKTYDEIAKLGVREVLGRHTLADRLEQVCEWVGINVKPHLPTINAIFNVHTETELVKAKTLFEHQTCRDKRLVVNLHNANVLYPYMNLSNADEIYRVETEFSKPLDGVSVKLSSDSSVANTYLEDIAIKSQYEVVEL